MEPRHFQLTRPEYQEFDADIFRQRIYQEVRYQKYCNYLEDARFKKRNKYREKKAKEKRELEEKKTKAEEKKRKAEEKKSKKVSKRRKK